ncbi:MAG TPA: MAPEG family protein [Burkholderiales bacterium]|nr:MAPEG family protein [Burkholderiales bacterium]
MSIEPARIFYPMIALASFTFAVLLLIPFRRFRAAFRGEVRAKDFRYGESANVPGEVAIPNRNLMNLLEMPVLFYVVCVALYVTLSVDPIAVYGAWAYVALRAAHSVVHLTYNNVYHRLGLYAASSVVLFALWVRWALALAEG